MGGISRHRVLRVWSPDPTLGLVSALGLAISVGTSLVIDMENPGQVGDRSLASLLIDGPTLDEVSPGRTGVACLPRGRADFDDASELIQLLEQRWPAIVIRSRATRHGIPSVPVVPLIAGRLVPEPETDHAVWQPIGGASKSPPGPGPVLPRLRGNVLRSLLNGRLPSRSRWISAWRPVWEMPWE